VKTEAGVQRSEIRSLRSEVRSQRSEVGGRRAEVGGQKTEGDLREARLIKSAEELRVYGEAYTLAMEIFEISKQWPKEEKYSLTDQVRRSSRAVCANLREAWAKRRYGAHFVSKLTDSDAENSETATWLDFSKDCGYLSDAEHDRLTKKCREIGSMLGAMLNNPAPFLIKKQPSDL